MVMQRQPLSSFQQKLIDWQKKLQSSIAGAETQQANIRGLEARVRFFQTPIISGFARLTGKEKPQLQPGQKPSRDVTGAFLVGGKRFAKSIIGDEERLASQTEAAILTDDIRIANKTLLKNIFYSDLYSIVPSLVGAGAVNSPDEALSKIALPDDLTPEELQSVKSEIAQLLSSRDRGVVTEESEETELPPLQPPSEKKLTAISIHSISTQAILRSLTAPRVPQTTMTREQYGTFLASKGYSEEDIDAEVGMTTEKLLAEAQNRKNLIESFKNDVSTLAPLTGMDILKMSIINPPLVALEALGTYYEHVSQPASGWLYGKAIPDITVAYNEFKSQNPDATDREAWVYAWNKWEAPGPPVLDFILKYMIMEGVVDPLMYAGWGIVTKGLRALGPAGRIAAIGNAYVGEVMELPFNYAKYIGNKVLPKTIRQTATVFSRNSESVIKVGFEKFHKNSIPLYEMTPKQMKDAGDFALEHLAKNPRAEDDFANTARELLIHAPVDKKTATNWVERLRKLGATEAITPDRITTQTLKNLSNDFEKVFTGQLKPSEIADDILKILNVNVTEDTHILAEKLLTDKANSIFNKALDFAASDTTRHALTALSTKQSKIYEEIASSLAHTEAIKAGRFALFTHNLEKGYVGSTMHYINRYVIRSAADSYLTFAGYGFGNAAEDIWRSVLGGVKPGRVSREDWDTVTIGLLSDPTLRTRGLSEMSGLLREADEGAWHNYILTLSSLSAGIPAYIVSRGKITPRQTGEFLFKLMVEMPGAFSADVRRNFVFGKMGQILADTGGEAYEALTKVLPKSIPDTLKDAPKWVKRNLLRDIKSFGLTGKLTSDNTELVKTLKARYTHEKIVKAELDDLLKKYPELSPSARSAVMKEYKEILKSADSINEFNKRLYADELDDFLRSPEKATVDFERLTEHLTSLEVTNPEAMSDLISGLYRMTATYGALPDQIMARATVKSRGLPVADRKLQFDTEFDRIHTFMDKAGASIDTVVSKIEADLAKMEGKTRAKGRIEIYKSALQSYLDLSTTARKVISEAKSQDIAFRSSYFADATQKEMRTPQFWEQFYASEMSHWKNVSKKLAVLNSQLHQSIGNINISLGSKAHVRSPIKVVDRPLAPSDVAKLVGARGDDLSQMLLNTLIPEGDKDYFVEYVMGLVKEGDSGFTRESVGAVYDQIASSMMIDPASSSWFRIRQQQLESLGRDLHDLYNSKLFPKEQKIAVDNFIDESVAKVTRIIKEAVIPDFDIGLGEIVSGQLSSEERVGLAKRMDADVKKRLAVIKKSGEKVELEGRLLSDEEAAEVFVYGIEGRQAFLEGKVKLIEDAAYLDKIRTKLTEFGKTVRIPPDERSVVGINNLNQMMDAWFKYSSNEALQVIGRTAEKTPEYLTKIRGILHEKYPSGYIRIYRGSGKAKTQFLNREYTNVTSSRSTARDFEPNQLKDFTWTDAGLQQVSERPPILDNVLVKIGDIVSIGSVDESELIIPARVLRDRIDNPLQPPLIEKVDFKNYDSLRQQALDEALKWYYKEYTDYTNANMLDAMMKQFFPFWVYESQRWLWLPRSFIRHPGTLAQWGRWENNTDQGYVHIPGTSIDINPFRGTVYGPWSTRLMKRDYPEYYDQLEGMGGLVGFFDFISRYGFYPNIIYGAALAQFGGATEQLGGILPAQASTPLNALIAAFPDNPVVNFISERVFPEQFRTYLTARGVDDLGGDGSLLFAKKKGGVTLTEEEESLWTQARRSTALHSAAFEQFGFARMRSDQSYALAQASEQFIEQNWGITVEQQKELKRRGEKLWDIIGGLDPWETAALQELEFFKYAGSVNPVLPGTQQEILTRIERDWNDVTLYSEAMTGEIMNLQQDFLTGSERGRLGPDDFLYRVKDLYKKRRDYIDKKTEANPLMLLSNRTEYYAKYRQPMPIQSPYNELMSLFFSIELEDTVDPGTGERTIDWNKFWANRGMIQDSIPEEDRAQWDAFLSRNTAPIMQMWQDVYNTYFKKYYSLYDEVLKHYLPEEQQIINEYLYLERTGQQLDKQALLKSTTTKEGKLIISDFRSTVSNEREALRYANPNLDAWLYYWGKSTSFKTQKAQDTYKQIAKQTGRIID